nr:putative ribonuclease H-like domain-containing protein [Tanacetum cinerariifolium]
TKIHIDNESIICIVRISVFHSKIKHIEIRHHFIRDSNENKLIQMIKIHTDKNIADLLTKAFDVTAKVKNINGEAQLHANVDGKKLVISKASIRRDLRFGDEGGIDCFSNEFIFEQLTLMSVPTETVADEAVNEEMYDSLEWATTTATSLDVKHDMGNISKTQFKATLNEPISIRTSSGSGPRRQDTIGDVVAQTRDKDIFGVNNQDDTSMFDADKDLQGEEVVEEVNAASIATSVIAAATTAVSFDELTLAQALVKIKTSKPKAKGIVMQEPSETPTSTSIVSSQQPSKRIEDENEFAELKRCLEIVPDDGDDVTIDATPL